VNLPAGLSRIVANTFIECRNLVSIVIPEGVTEIGAGAFYGCTYLPKIDLSAYNSAIYIYSEAFKYCYRLAEVRLPDILNEVSADTFTRCADNIRFYYHAGTTTATNITISNVC